MAQAVNLQQRHDSILVAITGHNLLTLIVLVPASQPAFSQPALCQKDSSDMATTVHF